MTIQEVVQQGLLYHTIPLSSKLEPKLIVNEYCHHCKQTMTFNYRWQFLRDSLFYDNNSPFHFYIANCPNDNESHVVVFFDLSDRETEMIGQYPEHQPESEYKMFKNIIDSSLMGLLFYAEQSHRLKMDVGAFVYMRRALEKIVQDYIKEFKIQVDARDHFSDLLKDVEKVQPVFPAELNSVKPQIYSFLSKGVHEWSEEECNKNYPYMSFVVTKLLEEEMKKQQDQNDLLMLQQVIGKSTSSKKTI